MTSDNLNNYEIQWLITEYQEIRKEIAENVLEFLGQLRTHRMYRRVFRNYIWDNIYNDLLRPLLEKV